LHSRLRDVVLSDGLKKIGSYVFRDCQALQRITVPSTVDEISSNAFIYCENLREVVLNDGIKKIKADAFGRCFSIERITIPSTVVAIEQYAFHHCSRLREIVVNNEGVQIDDQAFYNCISLERFKFTTLFTRLKNIIQAGQRDIEVKMDDISAVEWRGGELIIPAVRREKHNGSGRVVIIAGVDKEKLNKIEGLIVHYEMKEATTLFELALWKAKIDQADTSNPADRDACRTEVPGPVKDDILQYLR